MRHLRAACSAGAPKERSEDADVRARRPARRATHARHTAATSASAISATSGTGPPGVAGLLRDDPAQLLTGVPHGGLLFSGVQAPRAPTTAETVPVTAHRLGADAVAAADRAGAPLTMRSAASEQSPSGVRAGLQPNQSAGAPPGAAAGRILSLATLLPGVSTPCALSVVAGLHGLAPPRAAALGIPAAWNSGSRNRALPRFAGGAAFCLGGPGAAFGSTFSSAPSPKRADRKCAAVAGEDADLGVAGEPVPGGASAPPLQSSEAKFAVPPPAPQPDGQLGSQGGER